MLAPAALQVAEFKLWATIGRTFRSPASLTTSSHQVKKCYEDTIAAFDEALRKGEYKVPPPKHIRDAAAFRKQIAREAGAAAAATTAANRAAALLGGDSPDLADLPSPASSMGGPDIKQGEGPACRDPCQGFVQGMCCGLKIPCIAFV